MKVALVHIADIQTGIFAKPAKEGDLVYLQSRHFDENGKLLAVPHADLKMNNVTSRHLLKQGDLLFAAKGVKNFATCIDLESLPSVASTSFFVIRLHSKLSDRVLPQFLAWQINQQIAQKYLKANAFGTSMVSISKTVLEQLEISLPDIKTQECILRISGLRAHEKELKQKIETLYEQKIQQQLFNAIK